MAGPRFINQDVVNTYMSAGIDPRTGKPIRTRNPLTYATTEDFRKQLRVLDEQQAINRYV